MLWEYIRSYIIITAGELLFYQQEYKMFEKMLPLPFYSVFLPILVIIYRFFG